jgi:hypothetical protein
MTIKRGKSTTSKCIYQLLNFIILDIYCICFGQKWNISIPKLMTASWLGGLAVLGAISTKNIFLSHKMALYKGRGKKHAPGTSIILEWNKSSS